MNTSNGKPEGLASAAKPASSPEERLLERKVRAAGLTLLFEKLWPRIWLPIGVAGVFFLLSVFEVWPLLPPRVHFGLLWAFGVAFALSFLPLLFWRSPAREAALSRLERASALEHRPLTAFNDTLLQKNPTPETLALWEAHRARAAKTLKRLKAGAPHARTDKYDPFALRAALVLLLVAACSWAWGDLGARLQAAFTVPEAPAQGSASMPGSRRRPTPEKSRSCCRTRPPRATSPSRCQQARSLPSRSTALMPPATTWLFRRAAAPELSSPRVSQAGLTRNSPGRSRSRATLTVHRSFGASRTWVLNAIQDLPPKISFVGPVELSPRGVMLFKYKVEDDYGVSVAEARIERVPTQAAAPNGAQPTPQIGKPPVFPLSLPRPPVKSAEAKTYRDLTAHPWAGLPVVVTLVAKDEAGNEGFSVTRGVILPERKFMKPLAKAIAEQRRSLVEDPSSRFRIAGNLNALSLSGADENMPKEVYLNLRSAYWRLRGRLSIEDIESVADQLWDAAIRIEDGNLSAAERELRAAQERLKDALERGASSEEIQKLMAELRQALNQYLQALMQQQRSGKSNQAAISPNAKTVSPQDLEKLLSKIESLAKAGSPEAAAQMLNELRDILESVQAGSQERDAKGGENAEKLKQLGRLTDIMRQQQQLIDKTFRAQQGGDAGQNGGQGQQQEGEGGDRKASPGLKKHQEEVRKQLQELLSTMKPAEGGDVAQQKLKDAEKAMGDASSALDQSDLGEAGDQEGRALESMRQGTRSMAEDMARAAGQGNGNNQSNRDPLGRRQQDGSLLDNGDSVKVPDEITVQQARRILDELRKRLGEPARPPVELDYLERLVKPY